MAISARFRNNSPAIHVRIAEVVERKPETSMIAIVLSACLVNDPNVCRDYKIPIDADIDQVRCLAEAPPHFAKWAEEHPGWQVTRWRCGSVSEHDI